MTAVDDKTIESIGGVLQDDTKSLGDRFRALFTLRNLGGNDAVDQISKCFGDPSALLKHELAYCLGQMQNVYAIPVLTSVLEDKSQESMVRHEAGEALGAIGSEESIEILQKYKDDPVIEVAETCQLALDRIAWLNSSENQNDNASTNPYLSVDPAPPCGNHDINVLRDTLLNEQLPLFKRYRAMFSLRNMGTKESVHVLAEGLKCSSALFRHEIAYVLGQMQNDACISQLSESLRNNDENPMVRHECAEALGSIATEDSMKILEEYQKDKERVVRESCVVALDISEYEQSGQFQYADSLAKIKQKAGEDSSN